MNARRPARTGAPRAPEPPAARPAAFRGFRILWAGAIAFAVALAAANVLLGSLNQDEGWYLLAALRVARGQLPYRDFLFTQGPGLPLVYGLLAPLWSWAGVAGGRVLTALFGLAASALAARLAGELAPRRLRRQAQFAAWLLLACVPAHSYFTALPKTYALAAFFLLAGFNLLAGRRPALWLLGGAAIAFAAATRISLGLALPVTGVALLLRRRDPRWRNAWLLFGIGGAAALLATYGVALLRWPADFLFSQGYHAVRAGGGLMGSLTRRAGFASRCVQSYPLAWLLAAAASPLLMDWFLIRKDRFWFETKPRPDLLVLRDAARVVRAKADALGTDLLLTQDAYLAVQAGLDVPAGLEMGPFCLFPGLDSATARARHVHNVETMADLLRGNAADPGEPRKVELCGDAGEPRKVELCGDPVPVLAATSGYSFALACPGTDPLDDASKALLELELDAAFDPLGEPVDNFGQCHTRLTLWIRHGLDSRH